MACRCGALGFDGFNGDSQSVYQWPRKTVTLPGSLRLASALGSGFSCRLGWVKEIEEMPLRSSTPCHVYHMMSLQSQHRVV
jgi:hypothetical protein